MYSSIHKLSQCPINGFEDLLYCGVITGYYYCSSYESCLEYELRLICSEKNQISRLCVAFWSPGEQCCHGNHCVMTSQHSRWLITHKKTSDTENDKKNVSTMFSKHYLRKSIIETLRFENIEYTEAPVRIYSSLIILITDLKHMFMSHGVD